MKRLLMIFLFLALAACQSIRVQTDYERGQDWSSYSTYNLYPDLQTGLSDLDSRRLLSALETVLRQQGYRQAEDPDFLINITSDIYQSQTGSNIGLGVGGTGRNMGGGVSVGIPVSGSSLSRRITFDIIDQARNTLVWQGVSTDRFREDMDPLARERQLYRVVEKVFSKFPPNN